MQEPMQFPQIESWNFEGELNGALLEFEENFTGLALRSERDSVGSNQV